MIIQLIFDYINNSKKNIYFKIKLKLFLLFRSIISNKLIKYKIKNQTIYFPVLHGTLQTWMRSPNYSLNLGRVCKIYSDKYCENSIIDIGANIGDSCAIIRGHGVKNKIIAVEGVKNFYDVLLKNIDLLRNVIPVEKFITIGDNNNLKLRTLNDYNASLVYDEKLYKNETITLKELDTNKQISLEGLLNKFDCKDFKFLKIDIEGLDLPLLIQNLNLISQYQPIIFFECHVDEILEKVHDYKIVDFLHSLRKLNYEKISFWNEDGDFILNSDLSRIDQEILDILNKYKNKWGKNYLDICTYHKNDSDIAEKVRQNETNYFYNSYETYHSGDISHINFN